MIPTSIEELKNSLFFILDKEDGSSNAVIGNSNEGYNIMIFKQNTVGWMVSSGHVKKSLLVDLKKYDFTNDYDDAINHAKLKIK